MADEEEKFEKQIDDLRRSKARTATRLKRTRNRLQDAITNSDSEQVRDLRDDVVDLEEELRGILEQMIDVSRDAKQEKESITRIIKELERIEDDDRSILQAANRHLSATVDAPLKQEEKSKRTSDIGHDMWTQLQRVQVPVFSGDKRMFESWKAAFDACVDNAPATPEYKLLQLRQALQGEALRAIEGLGYSAEAYTVAKERLVRKFGGERRLIKRYLDELRQFRPIKTDSVKELEKFADLLDIATANMEASGLEGELGSGMTYAICLSKLSETLAASYHECVSSRGDSESVRTLRDWIVQQVEFRSMAMEDVNGLQGKSSERWEDIRARKARHQELPQQTTMNRSFFQRTRESMCTVCSASHPIWKCHRFQQMPVDDRKKVVKDANLCWLCLLKGHGVRRCRWTRPCGHNGCSRMHNRLLHTEYPFTNEQEEAASQRSLALKGETDESHSSDEAIQPRTHHAHSSTNISFRTVPAVVQGSSRQLNVLVLLDDASSTSYINEDVAAELGLAGPRKDITVSVVNGRTESFRSKEVTFTVSSTDGRYQRQVTAFTANKVVGNLKGANWNHEKQEWPHLRSIPFLVTDPRQKIDVLLGADCIDVHQCLKEIKGQVGEPIARLTPLGWTCVGKTSRSSSTCHKNLFSTYHGLMNIENRTDQLLRNFWEIEEIAKPCELTPAEQSAVDIAKQSLRQCDGRYEVAIPWKEGKPCLPDSRAMAMKRLMNTEKKLMKDKEISDAYTGTIASYVEKGYVTKLSVEEIEREPARWLLPHFPIVRLDKATTKVRIVFDASAEVGGISLNDSISPGPKLQRDLFAVLLRFRKHPVALVCDIEQMYLQIQIRESDRSYFRFLWRDLVHDKPPDEYEFNRLVFGINASPFLAQLVTQEHAKNTRSDDLRAAETILESTYMDDSLDSTPTTEEAIQLYKALSTMWEAAGMKARKWLSNSHEVLAEIPVADRAAKMDIRDDALPEQKALGIIWQASNDLFMFASMKPALEIVTKRDLLRIVASIFDPMGFLSPVVVRGRLLLQKIWTIGLQWDESLPPDLAQIATEWLRDIEKLNVVTVTRSLNTCEDTELHIFSDASEMAYGAVAYVRNGGLGEQFEIRFVAAKVKVSPLQAISVARLELMAAMIGFRLAEKICTSLNLNLHGVYFWSDSMNSLCWIRQQSRNFKAFVANRVGEIQSLTSPSQWNYVPGQVNPADLLSRGLSTFDLARSSLWWKGPDYLQHPEERWPKTEILSTLDQDQKELRKKRFVGIPLGSEVKETTNSGWTADEVPIEERYSCWTKLRRVLGRMLRFINNCRLGRSRGQFGELTVDELQDAETCLIRMTQKELFANEYRKLLKGEPLSQSSTLAMLSPVLDSEGIVRVDGRLRDAEFLPYNALHPVILPKSAAITRLIVKHFHEDCHHGGTNRTLAELTQRFWIISAREAIRSWEKKCSWCRRRKSRPSQQIMSTLPECRLTQSLRAFHHVSVDFGGPFLTRQGRGKVRAKRYLCLFTCLATRAVHLEMAFGLDTNSFLNAFFRMVSRRGLPEHVFSDNGTNFRRADLELKELVQKLDQSRIQTLTANRGIKWHFQPPYGPHFGGAHESLIKSSKRAINSVLGNAEVTDEELASVIVGAEGLLNSRPLTYQSTNHLDPEPLTPNHFLHGMCGGQFAPESVDTTNFPLHRRWRRVQELTRHVWRRWLREYIPTLQPRRKWTRERTDFAVGDVVLVVDPNTARGHWPLGRILEVFPGKDGHVRVVRVRISNQTFIRPVTRLCLLDPSPPEVSSFGNNLYEAAEAPQKGENVRQV